MRQVKELSHLPEFPTTHMPPFDRLSWRLEVDGLVAKPLRLSYPEVLALPAMTQASPFACLDGWQVSDNRWEGVTVRTVLDMAEPLPQARFVIFHAGSFVVSLSLATVRRPTALLAFKLNGAPLTPEHGFPLRLVVPDKQCYYGVKWVHRLEVARRARQTGKTIALGRLRRSAPSNQPT